MNYAEINQRVKEMDRLSESEKLELAREIVRNPHARQQAIRGFLRQGKYSHAVALMTKQEPDEKGKNE